MRDRHTYEYTDKYTSCLLTCFNDFHLATPVQRAMVCNGAGPRNFGYAVPDSMYGQKLTIIFDQHDWDYQWGETIEDKMQADRVMRNNLIRAIAGNKRAWKITKALRRISAQVYYTFVKNFGGPSFFLKRDEIDFTYSMIGMRHH